MINRQLDIKALPEPKPMSRCNNKELQNQWCAVNRSTGFTANKLFLWSKNKRSRVPYVSTLSDWSWKCQSVCGKASNQY
ncbi:hypothetical protein DPMN_034198 [Dreissena polymorpha]|uniref:Uncharacterized protein n=1 Tax=Dreissena polymorpha TaxID=45954 RepID=A0A9D4RJV2_DREPO|nr:hypothetical protein DPMN_034198 [Dreissena polymorpha]